MIHSEAAQIAIRIYEELEPYCDKICVAGSVRRGKPEVHDIELVCLPTVNPDPNIFHSKYLLLDYLNNPKGYLLSGHKLKGQSKYQQWILEHPRIMLDLFIVTPPAQYGVILAIRTGPGDLSRLLVTKRKMGGYLPSYALVHEGAVWVDHKVLEMPEENDFFEFCGLHFILPTERDEFLKQRN